ncbi:MAG: hypothetical protein JO072_14110 [Parafilimonas sp.]|nr:hypothetical protein [Parafilimonas sp.]
MNLKLFCFALIALPGVLHAQQTQDSTEKSWTGFVEADYYFIPADEIHPTITASVDHKALHLEARYNYEDFNTASFHVGYSWQKDGDFSVTATATGGIAVGLSNGILPGFECSADYSKLSFYSENEYMFAFNGKENNFFYSWTQLSASIFKNVSVGVSAETLKLYKTKFDVQKGVYAEYAAGKFLFDVYYFNPFSQYNYVVGSVAFNF